jgi:hypothetical protein
MNAILMLTVLIPGQAQAQAPGQPIGQVAQPIRSGKVLLLENERTIEGEVDKFADFYRVRRSVGETQIPTHQVLALCSDQREAYDFLRKRTNLQDPDERFKLAQWAQVRGLLAEAHIEIQAALALRPNHDPSKRLKQVIEQMDRREKEKKLFPEKPGIVAGNDGIAPLPFEVSTDALGVFCQKIQPLLMNSCASCHATGKGGNFKLVRVYMGSSSNKRVLQNNMAAVLAQVTPQQIGASPILVKSVSVHGDLTQAPLHNRGTPAFRMLEEWIRNTVNSTPFEPGQTTLVSGTAPLTQAVVPAMVQPAALANTSIKTSGFASSPISSADGNSRSEIPATGPKTIEPKMIGNTEGPKDPYDPAGFNGPGQNTEAAPTPGSTAPGDSGPLSPSNGPNTEPTKVPPVNSEKGPGAPPTPKKTQGKPPAIPTIPGAGAKIPQ